MLPLY